MAIFEAIDKSLAARGWRYDRGEEQFMHGDRVLTWGDVIGLVPDLTPDELASYQDDQWVQHCQRRTHATA